jgi:hypothetical protein
MRSSTSLFQILRFGVYRLHCITIVRPSGRRPRTSAPLPCERRTRPTSVHSPPKLEAACASRGPLGDHTVCAAWHD